MDINLSPRSICVPTLPLFTVCSTFCQAADRISILLREMNAKNFHQLSTARQNIQLEMFNFTDKLISVLAERCMCCRIRGFADCPLRDSSPQPGSLLFLPMYTYTKHIFFSSITSFHHHVMFRLMLTKQC
jgi:hypothetical protein